MPTRTAGSPAEHALVYLTLEGLRYAVHWRSLDSGECHVLYETEEAAYVPRDLGFLPSPDGRWLLIWQYHRETTHRTRWVVVSLPDGETTIPLGESEGEARLLPFWRDAETLCLMADVTLRGKGEMAVFQTSTRTLSKSVPEITMVGPGELRRIGKWVERTRLETYAQRWYADALRTLYSARQSLPLRAIGELWVTWDERHEPPEYLLLSALGIPTLDVLRGGFHVNRLYPQFAVSPDGRFLAYAWVCKKDEEERRCQSGTCSAAPAGVQGRVDVLEVETGTRVSIACREWQRSEPLPELEWELLLPGLAQPHFRDPRWSPDGRFLSFCAAKVADSPTSYVTVVDASTWEEVIRIPYVYNAFVVPASASAGR